MSITSSCLHLSLINSCPTLKRWTPSLWPICSQATHQHYLLFSSLFFPSTVNDLVLKFLQNFALVGVQVLFRAITSASGNFCKIEKGGTFTHFGPKKHPHQWVQNCAFMHNCYSNRAYMHGYCSTCINILVFFFLSLFLSGALSSLSLLPHSPWSTSRLPHEELHRSTSHHCRRSTSHHCRRSASNHTPLDQIAADHSPLKIKPF